MRAVFIDANPVLGAVAERLYGGQGYELTVNRQPEIKSEEVPQALGDAEIVIIDHTHLPTDIARQCANLKHVVFLGTGPRSYMNPDELAEIGIQTHIVKGYGDTAVAECAFALMWASAKALGHMDRGMRAGQWLRTEVLQLTGKTLGLIGFGGIAAELARLANGVGMNVVAWNRTAKSHPGVTFLPLEEVLAASQVVSIHLLLTDETRGFISKQVINGMRDGAILINTARGAIVDEAAMLQALASGKLQHAGLDVFDIEPLPADHPFTRTPNVTLSAHSAFRTPEASDNLVGAALEHCRRLSGTSESL